MKNETNKTYLTRQELYNLVWAKPTRTLASELGISDSMIGKICKKHNIPKPPLGYWSRLSNGYKDKIAPLPKLKDPQLENIQINPENKETPETEFPEEISSLLAFEDLPENKIEIPERLGKTHPLLSAAKKSMLDSKYTNDGLLQSSRNELHLCVSKEHLDRTIKFFATLVNAFEARGFRFSKENDVSPNMQLPTVEIIGQKIQFRIQERMKKTVIHALDQIKDKHLKQRYSYNFKSGDAYLIPSGELYLQIDSYTHKIRCQKAWTNKPHNTLEAQLNEIMKGLIIAAYGKKLHRDILDAEHKKYADQAKQRRNIEMQEKEKKDRMNTLRVLVKEQQEYLQVKDLKNQLEARLVQDSTNIEVDQALKWANEFLSESDPLTLFLTKVIKPLMEKHKDPN